MNTNLIFSWYKPQLTHLWSAGFWSLIFFVRGFPYIFDSPWVSTHVLNIFEMEHSNDWKLSASAGHIIVNFRVRRLLSWQTLNFNISRSFLMSLSDSLKKPLLILLQGKDLLPAFFVQVKKTELGPRLWAVSLLKSTFKPPYIRCSLCPPFAWSTLVQRFFVWQFPENKSLGFLVGEGIWVRRRIKHIIVSETIFNQPYSD